MSVGFIGTGNMGSAIVKAYAASDASDGSEILVYNRTKAKAEALADSAGPSKITLAGSIEEITKASDILFICVEPKNFAEVMPEVARCFSEGKLLVSIAAGITISELEGYLGQDAKIIRSMPNTPIMHGMGATAMVRNANVSDEDFGLVKNIFESGGISGEVSEDLISAIIGISGSSPAYTYMYIDALIQTGIECGLDPGLAREFAAQTVKGAAQMLLSSSEPAKELLDRVCTPGGTTIEAVTSLKESYFEDIVKDGALAAVHRSKEMSQK